MVKRLFDIVLALVASLLLIWPVMVFYLLAIITTGSNGFFTQKRIGRYGKLFTIYKLKSMSGKEGSKYVTPLGRFMRKYKIDELPQLYNIIKGDMSFVGPRPDFPGYYDVLTGADRELLLLRPGLTGPASIKYADEEMMLAQAENPKVLNDEILFPDKVRLNRLYQEKQSLWLDIEIIGCTLIRRMPKDFK